MFKLYDLDMNEIPFPDGVKPLDIFVGSIAKERQTEAIPGRNGVVDYGTNYTERSVDLSLWIISRDSVDYRLLRNELYALFDARNEFYVAESNVPSRVLKVAVDESYIPERITQKHASVDITCRTLDSVFWESTYTTLELHDSGYSAIAEKYGLVDNIDDEKVKYRFEPSLETVIPTSELFEQGNIHTGGGYNLETTEHARSKGFFQTLKGSKYTLNLSDTTGNSRYIRIYNYNSDGSYISDDSGMFSAGNEYTFTALGENLRLVVYPVSGRAISLSDIGSSTKISMYTPSTSNTFSVYNAGNVTVEPESMELYIRMNYVTSDGDLKLINKTTGEKFEYHRTINRKHIVLNGMIMTEGGVNRFRDTNREFISLAPGDNEFEITGATFNEIRFNFKYYYK